MPNPDRMDPYAPYLDRDDGDRGPEAKMIQALALAGRIEVGKRFRLADMLPIVLLANIAFYPFVRMGVEKIMSFKRDHDTIHEQTEPNIEEN